MQCGSVGLEKKLAGYLLQSEISFKAVEEVVLVLLAVSRVSTVTAYNFGKFDESPIWEVLQGRFRHRTRVMPTTVKLLLY